MKYKINLKPEGGNMTRNKKNAKNTEVDTAPSVRGAAW